MRNTSKHAKGREEGKLKNGVDGKNRDIQNNKHKKRNGNGKMYRKKL